MGPLLIAIGTFLLDWVLPKLLAVGGTVAVSLTVIQPIFSYLQNAVTTRINGLPADAVHFLQFVGVPDAISIIFAAYTMVIGLRAAKAAYQRSGSKP